MLAQAERITGHATYTNIDKVLQIVDEINSNDKTSKQIEMLGRVTETFTFIKDALDRVDPWLVSINTLQNINNPISQTLNEVTNFKNNRNEQHLNNALSHIETLLQYSPQLLVTKTPEDIEGVRSAVIKFRQSVGQHLSHLEKDVNDTKTAYSTNKQKLGELTNSIESQKNRIDSIISDFQNQFLNGQTERNEKVSQLITDTKNEFDEIFQSNEEKLDNQIEEQKDLFKTQIEQQKADFNNIVNDFKTKIQEKLDQIIEMNEKAEKILGIMSMKGLAQGYQKIANIEGRKALFWNILSIGSLIGLLWFGYEFIIKFDGTMSWTSLISRFILTGVGLTLFTYGAKQATNHRQEERRNRKIELELASLDPYLKDLEEEKQREVKQSLVNKYFGVELPIVSNPKGQPQSQNMVETITNNPQLLQVIAEKVVQITSQK